MGQWRVPCARAEARWAGLNRLLSEAEPLARLQQRSSRLEAVEQRCEGQRVDPDAIQTMARPAFSLLKAVFSPFLPTNFLEYPKNARWNYDRGRVPVAAGLVACVASFRLRTRDYISLKGRLCMIGTCEVMFRTLGKQACPEPDQAGRLQVNVPKLPVNVRNLDSFRR